MSTDPAQFSAAFQQLYCDPTLFETLSGFHPISFLSVLPFQSQDVVMDDPDLLAAEAAHLAGRSDHTRRAVVAAYARCALLPGTEAASLISIIDYFDTNFYELMGLVYANAGMFICALRWYRELITELENQNSQASSEEASVYASVGYCLYSLGLFAEAVAWSKSCLGPLQTADVVYRALLTYEVQQAGGALLATERAGGRTRYTVSALDPVQAQQTTSRLIAAMNAFAPSQGICINWVSSETPAPEIQPGDYPFMIERDSSSRRRHKMNLLFATCSQADVLAQRGCVTEAKQLLLAAALLEPNADFVAEKIQALPRPPA